MMSKNEQDETDMPNAISIEKMKQWADKSMVMLEAKQAKPHYGMNDVAQRDRNCITYWLPKIVAAGVPCPETRWVMIANTSELVNEALDGKTHYFIDALAGMINAMADDERIGWPCFLRNGHFSGKHRWEETCFLADREKTANHIADITEMAAMVGVAFGDPAVHGVWCVREMLKTNPVITCSRYGNFPVAREARVFVENERIAYWVPYWPKGAIEEGHPIECDWRDRMDGLEIFTDAELHDIRSLASRCGKACGGRWSVDVLDTENGFYVTDMAEAEMSYGYDEERYVQPQIESGLLKP